MKTTPVIHPFLFALYPLLVTISLNFWQVSSWDILRLTFFVFLFCCILLLLFRIIVKDWQRAGLLTSIAIILIFYINYSKYIPEDLLFTGFSFKRYWGIFLFWLLIIFIANSKLFWGRIRPYVLTRFLNITASMIIVLSIFNLWPFINSYISDPLRGWSQFNNTSLESISSSLGENPDIYYIIVDGYARGDVLSEFYNFDNSEFINYLKDLGFYVAEESQTNYIFTALSISSSLNMDYVNNLGVSALNSDNREPLKKLTHNSKVRSLLEMHGYDFISVSSGYYVTEIKDSDIYLSSGSSYFSALEILLFESTGLQLIWELLKMDSMISGDEIHRRRVLQGFGQLEKIPQQYSNKKKFVFAHVVFPHPPFIFNQYGDPISVDSPFTFLDGSIQKGSTKEYDKSYVNQLIYTNKLLTGVIDSILKNTKSPPIIILQSDHGPGLYHEWESSQDSCLKERFSILNAYYLPQDSMRKLYPTITPVNTFRIIFDSVFGTEFGKLPDLNYFSRWGYLYDFVDVTSQTQLPCDMDDLNK